MFYNCLNESSLNICLYKNKSIKSWRAVNEFSFGQQQQTCNSLLFIFIPRLLKAVHCSSLHTRAPETRQMRTQTTQILLIYCKAKHMAGQGHFYLRYFHRTWQHTSPPIVTENKELKRRESLCLNSTLYFWDPRYSALVTCSEARAFLDLNVRFYDTVSTAHPPVTNQRFVD